MSRVNLQTNKQTKRVNLLCKDRLVFKSEFCGECVISKTLYFSCIISMMLSVMILRPPTNFFLFCSFTLFLPSSLLIFFRKRTEFRVSETFFRILFPLLTMNMISNHIISLNLCFLFVKVEMMPLVYILLQSFYKIK